MFFSFINQHYLAVLPYLLDGLRYTLLITIVGIAFGFALGALAGIARLPKSNKILYAIATVYVEVMRGTPMLAQIFLIFFTVFLTYSAIISIKSRQPLSRLHSIRAHTLPKSSGARSNRLRKDKAKRGVLLA